MSNTKEDHNKPIKNKFAAIIGAIKQEEEAEEEDHSVYFRLVEVRKVREITNKSKLLFDIGDSILDLHSEKDVTVEDAPPKPSSFLKVKLSNAEGRKEKARVILLEWITYLIIEKDLEYVGVIKGDPQRLPLNPVPNKLRFDIKEE